MPETLQVRVLVAGAAGRMGREVVRAVQGDSGCELAGAVDVSAVGEDAGVIAGLGPLGVPIGQDLRQCIDATRPDVLVDFTRAEAAYANALIAVAAGVSPVIGTTGIPEARVGELADAAGSGRVGLFMAPNFAIGAVLMMIFARQAARHFPEVEIIELHHEKKQDAPSGTALRTAQMILEERAARVAERPEREDIRVAGARGADLEGIRIHSVRLPGYVAHQEVLFGGPGQTLVIRHDSTDRGSFMPGVLLAVKRVRSLNGLVVGLEHLLE